MTVKGDKMDENFLLPVASEELRRKLLRQEFRLRKKQPTAWTKTKFRKYANFRTKKKEPEKLSSPAI